jgi:hypothetical protein
MPVGSVSWSAFSLEAPEILRRMALKAKKKRETEEAEKQVGR